MEPGRRLTGEDLSGLNARSHGVFASVLAPAHGEGLRSTHDGRLPGPRPSASLQEPIVERIALACLPHRPRARAEGEYYLPAWLARRSERGLALGRPADVFDPGRFGTAVTLARRRDIILTDRLLTPTCEPQSVRRRRSAPPSALPLFRAVVSLCLAPSPDPAASRPGIAAALLGSAQPALGTAPRRPGVVVRQDGVAEPDLALGDARRPPSSSSADGRKPGGGVRPLVVRRGRCRRRRLQNEPNSSQFAVPLGVTAGVPGPGPQACSRPFCRLRRPPQTGGVRGPSVFAVAGAAAASAKRTQFVAIRGVTWGYGRRLRPQPPRPAAGRSAVSAGLLRPAESADPRRSPWPVAPASVCETNRTDARCSLTTEYNAARPSTRDPVRRPAAPWRE